MSPITAQGNASQDFQSDLPLHPAASDLLAHFFAIGWPDPTKLHQQSAHLRNMVGAAKEIIASNLGLQLTELEFVGELGFGFQTALGGLMQDSGRPFIHSQIDRQVVHAFARSHSVRGGMVKVLQPTTDGSVDFSVIEEHPSSILSWQATNRETGVIQESPTNVSDNLIFADMTASFPLNRLPERWDSALWDPRSFAGPQGLAIIGISQTSRWRNPGPQIDNRRVFGSFSKPLLLATAVALENWIKTSQENLAHLKKLNATVRDLIKRLLPHAIVAGDPSKSDPRYIALAIPNVIAEEVLRKVETQGFLIDAGSACGAGALEPSHVLTALGMPTDGNLRITLKPEHSREGVESLVKGIAASA